MMRRFGAAERAGQRALVVFTGATDIPLLRLLKPGFRHCFAALPDGDGWILYEPLSNRTEISTARDIDADRLADAYRRRGCAVVAWRIGPPRARAIFPGPFTCVAAVKRVLRIYAPFGVTPYRLYRHLAARQANACCFTDKEYNSII